MKISILTISDTRNFDNDTSGLFIKDFFISKKNKVINYEIVIDEKNKIKNKLLNYTKENIDLILTTGGTGVAPRDVTPEATSEVIEKKVPGISEYIRYISFQKTSHACLSRNVSGIKNKTLIVNLPGSKKAVSEILPLIYEPLVHAIDLINNRSTFH